MGITARATWWRGSGPSEPADPTPGGEHKAAAAGLGGRLATRRSDGMQILVLVAVMGTLLGWGLLGGRTQLAIDIAMFITLAYSWNVISGFTGYISFGQVLFFGYGALTTALLIIHLHMAWYLAALVAGASAGVFAALIGLVMLRLHGIFFALGMFGLVFVVSLLVSQWSFTGGSTGLVVPGELAQKPVLFAVILLAVLAFALNAFMGRSAFGLRAMAIRDDEPAAAAMGVPTTRVKVLAFTMSAVLPATVGGVVAYNRAFIDHSTIFDATIDLQVIVFVLAGGIGTIWGPLIGAITLTLASDRLATALPDYELALFGALVILITMFLPGGIVSAFNRRGWLRRDIVKGVDRIATREELEAILLDPADSAAAAKHGVELLSCRGVDVQFGGVRALQGVDFTVNYGDTLFIIGANGAGKTTLFNAITGMVKPSAGSIVFDGVTVDKLAPHQLARRGLGRTFQIPRPFESMTVWENILVGALGGRKAEHAVEQTAWVIRVLDLEDICFAATATLSVGHRRMVELGRALALGPKLILLDEVMAGMSDDELERVRSAIGLMPSVGVGAVAGIEHVIKGIIDLSTEITVLDNGAKILTGEPREILAHPEVIRAYLGGPLSKDATS